MMRAGGKDLKTVGGRRRECTFKIQFQGGRARASLPRAGVGVGVLLLCNCNKHVLCKTSTTTTITYRVLDHCERKSLIIYISSTIKLYSLNCLFCNSHSSPSLEPLIQAANPGSTRFPARFVSSTATRIRAIANSSSRRTRITICLSWLCNNVPAPRNTTEGYSD